jgi:fructuronate reductase
MHFVRNRARDGERVVDPWSERLFEIGAAAEGRASADLPRFFELENVFAGGLVAEPRFTAALGRAYDALSVGEITSTLQATRATESART